MLQTDKSLSLRHRYVHIKLISYLFLTQLFTDFSLLSSIRSQILPQFIFNSRDPIVMGIMVENGIVKVGTPICVPSKEVSQTVEELAMPGKYLAILQDRETA